MQRRQYRIKSMAKEGVKNLYVLYRRENNTRITIHKSWCANEANFISECENGMHIIGNANRPFSLQSKLEQYDSACLISLFCHCCQSIGQDPLPLLRTERYRDKIPYSSELLENLNERGTWEGIIPPSTWTKPLIFDLLNKMTQLYLIRQTNKLKKEMIQLNQKNNKQHPAHPSEKTEVVQ